MAGNWIDFAQTMFATLLGFFLSILASIWVYRRTQKDDRDKDEKEVIKGITEEFEYIAQQCSSIEKDDLQFSPIETPFWHSLVTGARLSLINDKTCFRKIASVYAKVDEINTWSKLKTERYIEVKGSAEEKDEPTDHVIDHIEDIIERERINESGTLIYLIEQAKRELECEQKLSKK